MNLAPTKRTTRVVTRAAIACGAVVAGGLLWAGPEDAIRLEEAETAMAAALSKVRSLQDQVEGLATKNHGLTESLAAANAEAQQFREDYQELRLQLEALGVDILRQNSRGLDQRLLNAVNDLRLAEKESDGLSGQLVELSEAVLGYMRSSVSSDIEARLRVETELRETDALLGMAVAASSPLQQDARTLKDSRVVSVKSDFGLVVVDTGRREGLRIGTPLRLYRKDKPVASALVVDVRDKIAGAIVTRTTSGTDTVAVGDVARLESFNPSKR